jgi:hypothetical protein
MQYSFSLLELSGHLRKHPFVDYEQCWLRGYRDQPSFCLRSRQQEQVKSHEN